MKQLGLIDKDADPIYDQRNPHQTFLLVFGSWAAAAVFLDGDPGSRSLDRALGDAEVFGWAAALLLGSVLALMGQFWGGRTWNGLVLERAGLALVAVGALVFAGAVIVGNPFAEVRYVVALNTAFALSNVWRCVQITRRLRWIREMVARVNAAHADGTEAHE